jgi:hypothetical protein
MEAEIADLNCHLHAGRELRHRPSKTVEFPMHVADERDHRVTPGLGPTKPLSLNPSSHMSAI